MGRDYAGLVRTSRWPVDRSWVWREQCNIWPDDLTRTRDHRGYSPDQSRGMTDWRMEIDLATTRPGLYHMAASSNIAVPVWQLCWETFQLSLLASLASARVVYRLPGDQKAPGCKFKCLCWQWRWSTSGQWSRWDNGEVSPGQPRPITNTSLGTRLPLLPGHWATPRDNTDRWPIVHKFNVHVYLPILI